jgi:hypothetical protein
MSTIVPQDYPFGMSDDDLRAALAEMLETTRRAYEGVSFRDSVPELKLAIVMTGVQELSRRETAQLRASAEKAARAGRPRLEAGAYRHGPGPRCFGREPRRGDHHGVRGLNVDLAGR